MRCLINYFVVAKRPYICWHTSCHNCFYLYTEHYKIASEGKLNQAGVTVVKVRFMACSLRGMWCSNCNKVPRHIATPVSLRGYRQATKVQLYFEYDCTPTHYSCATQLTNCLTSSSWKVVGAKEMTQSSP